MECSLTTIDIARAAQVIGHASRNRFGRDARAAIGRDDLTQADYVALKAETVRQDAIRVSRAAARKRVMVHPIKWRLAAQKRLRYFGRKREAAKKLRKVRRAIQTTLRQAGYLLEHSADGSNYYWADNDVVRVSDHAVPETDERDDNTAQGRTSWAHRAFLDVRDYATAEAAVDATLAFVGKDDREE